MAFITAANKVVRMTFKSKIPMKGQQEYKISAAKIAGTTALFATLFPGITFEIADNIAHEIDIARAESEGRETARNVTLERYRAKLKAFKTETRLIAGLSNSSVSREAANQRDQESNQYIPNPNGYKPLVNVTKGTRSRALQFASLASLGGVDVARKAALALFATDVLSGVITGNSTSGVDFGDTFLDIVKLYSIGATADGLL